jgi:hypothetical protein
MTTAPVRVTLLLSPTTALTWYPPASRLVTAALAASPGLEVTLSREPVRLYLDSLRRHRRALRRRPLAGVLDSYMRLPLRAVPHLDVVAGHYDERLLAAVPTDVVLLSALSVFDLMVVKLLLGAGRRVVLGGNLTTLYSTERLRGLLRAIGADEAQLHRDLVVVRGYVTPRTDLGAVVREWRDVELAPTPADLSGMLAARADVVLPYVDAIAMAYRRVTLALPLATGCWYGQCEFCTARNQPQLDFTAGMEPAAVLGHLRELAALYRTPRIILTDNYLRLTPREQEILAPRAPLHVSGYSGVRLLLDPDYVRTANRCLDGLRIGVESGADATLAAIHKGFTFADLERVATNLIDGFDREKELTLLIVYDLPHASAAEVRAGFARLVALKTRLLQAGFQRVVVSGFPLLAFPDTALLASPLLEARPAAELDDDELAGGWVLHRWYERRHGVTLPPALAHLMTAYRRRAADGAVLPPDFRILDQATVDFLEDAGQGGVTADL